MIIEILHSLSIHMDLLYNAFSIFLDLLSFGYLDFQWMQRERKKNLINIFNCVTKINQTSMGLQQHKGE